jgi:Ca2+-binding EF-hand superfamily protein
VEREPEAYDSNGDGYLSLPEFRNTLIAARSGDPAALFRSIDTDGDGRITVSEIKAWRALRDPAGH